MTWWERKNTKSRKRALAYYRHSAEGRQENSIEIQQDQVRAFAEKNDIEIIREYADPGKSGLTAEGRKGFQALREHVKRAKTENINYVLCLDISRWGRFQNLDRAAAYESECAEYGVKVKYVVHGDLEKEEDIEEGFNDSDFFFGVRKNVERAMASKYSSDLSKKVFNGAVKVSEQGNRAGGPPPFGMLRIEMNEQKQPLGIMKPKQHKSYPNNRVRLVPDSQDKAETVKEIFDLFVAKDCSERQIAAILNERHIPAPAGGNWPTTTIRRILQDEQYIGSVVYNRTSAKLKSKRVKNAREKWIIKPNTYPQVISSELFEAAQTKFNLRRLLMSREEIQSRIRFAFEKYHMLSYALMQSLPDMPTRREIIAEFGSLPEAIQSLYPEIIEQIRNDIYKIIESKSDSVICYDDFLVINEMFSVKIEPTLPMPRGYGFSWFFRVDMRSNVDITLGVPLRDFKGSQILGYFPFPRVLTDEPFLCFSDSSKFKIKLYGYSDLSFIFDLMRWTSLTKDKEANNG